MEVREHSYGDPSENLLVQGDNLEALKALLPYYSGKLNCIYIDPPYNTGSAFSHYDDALEHSKWLSVMYPRLELLRDLLHEAASIWVSIDDREGHYLKVLMDEVFGRRNFITNVIWRKNYSPKSSARHFSEDHDHVLVYAKNADLFRPNLMPRTEKQDKAYKNPDSDPRGAWKTSDLSARNYYSEGMYSVTTPSGRIINGPPKGRYWTISKENFDRLNADNQIWWGKKGDAIPQRKRFLTEVKQGVVPQTIWPYEEVGHTQAAKKEIVQLFGADVFGTPKPEKLMQRILHIATKPGDLVLDSFLGSGTTAAVAHKMGRRWIGVEMGEHAKTHCALRLKKVVDGEQGGVSVEQGWKGGGGFRFCTLGPAIFDENGRIDPSIKFDDLARHVWFSETKRPLSSDTCGTIIGVEGSKAYALLYNGILADRTDEGGNILTASNLRLIREDLEKASPGFVGDLVIYAAASRLGPNRHKEARIIFKQTPYDIAVRG